MALFPSGSGKIARLMMLAIHLDNGYDLRYIDEKQMGKVDQEFLAGIGNAYADEILFRAGIHLPRVPVCSRRAPVSRSP